MNYLRIVELLELEKKLEQKAFLGIIWRTLHGAEMENWDGVRASVSTTERSQKNWSIFVNMGTVD